MYQLIIILSLLFHSNRIPQPSSWKIVQVNANLEDKEEIERMGLDFLINEKIAQMNLRINLSKDSLFFIENGRIKDATKIVAVKKGEIFLKDKEESFSLKYTLRKEGKECIFFSEENGDFFCTKKVE